MRCGFYVKHSDSRLLIPDPVSRCCELQGVRIWTQPSPCSTLIASVGRGRSFRGIVSLLIKFILEQVYINSGATEQSAILSSSALVSVTARLAENCVQPFRRSRRRAIHEEPLTVTILRARWLSPLASPIRDDIRARCRIKQEVLPRNVIGLGSFRGRFEREW